MEYDTSKAYLLETLQSVIPINGEINPNPLGSFFQRQQ